MKIPSFEKKGELDNFHDNYKNKKYVRFLFSLVDIPLNKNTIKINNKKFYRPTNPLFFWHVTRNISIFLFRLCCWAGGVPSHYSKIKFIPKSKLFQNVFEFPWQLTSTVYCQCHNPYSTSIALEIRKHTKHTKHNCNIIVTYKT